MIIEICTGGYRDALAAYRGGAERIELNQALTLGGLTPSIADLKLIREEMPTLKIISMVRPRAAGFCYSEDDFKSMEAQCREIMKAGSHGVVFGILKSSGEVDTERSRRMVDIIKNYGGEAVFHRAFDVSSNMEAGIESLIEIGIDRVLTSGGRPTAWEGRDVLKLLNQEYGSHIQILAGSGVNAGNVRELAEYTGLEQFHSSCKSWERDETTVSGVSFSIPGAYDDWSYDCVSQEMVRSILEQEIK